MSSARRTQLIDEPSGFAEARAAEAVAMVKRNAQAARTVADHSDDAADCSRLLAMLGIDPSGRMTDDMEF